jgi:hypothetical protein
MEPNKILAPLWDLVSTLSEAYSCHYSLRCVWALHFKLSCQVCFLSPRIHQTTDTHDGDESGLLSQSPLVVSPKAVGPFITPSAESSHWIDFHRPYSWQQLGQSLRGGTWRADCRKSQKVAISQGDTSPSQETSVCMRDISVLGQFKKRL